MRYKITLSYNGAQFFGWQRQSELPSVQQTLEEALSTLLRCPVTVTGAGRTDTLVSAAGYVAHFDACNVEDCIVLTRKLNAVLPQSVSVLRVEEAAEDFNSRFDAVQRSYTYFVHRCKDPFVAGYSYQYSYPVLDVEAMNRAASYLIGQHDFSSFEKTWSDNKTSICTVTRAVWSEYTPVVCAGGSGEYLKFEVSADRFLRNMVRAIVGTLLEVGRGKRSPESVADLLNLHDRCSAGESVPGHALFLTEIKY